MEIYQYVGIVLMGIVFILGAIFVIISPHIALALWDNKHQAILGGKPKSPRPPPPQDATPQWCLGCGTKDEIIRYLSSELEKMHEAEKAKGEMND